MDMILDYMTTTTTLFIVIFLYLLHRYNNKKPSKNLPPTPPSIPFIGHLHLLKPPRHLSIHSLSKLYGPVVALRLGSRNAIILSSPAAVEEALIKNDALFSNHPILKGGEILSYNNTTMFFSPHGPHWSNLRRLTALQLFSTSRVNLLAGIRTDELLSLIRRMMKSSSSSGAEIELKGRLFEMNYNSLSKMVVGKRYYGEDLEVANQFMEYFHKGLELMFSFNPRDFFPALGWMDLLGVEKRMEKLRPQLDGFLAEIVEEHQTKRRDVASGRDHGGCYGPSRPLA